MSARQCLSLSKGRERYVFWYYRGQESQLLASLVDLAANAQRGFDWFDAAVLSYQLGKPGEGAVAAPEGCESYSENVEHVGG